MPPDAPEPTTEAFLEAAVRSGLVDRDRLAAAVAVLPESERQPERLAGHLVSTGVLTRFQADKLLLGRWQGLVIGAYRLLCPIGRGGMGIVYLANTSRPSDPPLMAIKVLPPKRARDEPRTLARFRREMEIGLRLPAHPALVRTLDTGESGGVTFLAMEYAEGLTARQMVAVGGPLSVAAAARIFADTASGLHTLHQTGFIHRDFKPGNIIVSPRGRGKVLDFGFAVRRGERAPLDPALLGGRGYTMGTLDYLPPEQAVDAIAVGAETDIYSLGCSLYFVLTGRPPFPGGSPKEKIRNHRDKEPDSITQHNPDVPPDFARLVSWMMAKRPEDRPQSAAMLASELERWAAPAVPEAQLSRQEQERRAAEVLREVQARWDIHMMSSSSEVALIDAAAPPDQELIILDDLPEGLVLDFQAHDPVNRPPWYRQLFEISRRPLVFILLSFCAMVSICSLLRVIVLILRKVG